MFPFFRCGGDVNNNTVRDNRETLKPTIRNEFVRIIRKQKLHENFSINDSQVLGKGAFGLVAVAEHIETHTNYAVKVVHKAHAEKGRLGREIKVLSDLDHPNIVRLFSLYDTSSRVFFVMEYCRGGHLGSLILRQPNKCINEEFAKKLFQQIISAVAYIHRRGIVHRDIKIQNILVEGIDDQHATIKLIDFGHSTKFTGNLPMSTKCGTLSTTAPEVILESYDDRCDVWSVGVVLFTMLSGRRPFEAVTTGGDIVVGRLTDAEKAMLSSNILAGKFNFKHSNWENVSISGINYVKALMCQDYRARMTSHQAAQHPWLQQGESVIKSNNSLLTSSTKVGDIIERLKNIPNTCELERAIMLAVSFGLPSFTHGCRTLKDIYSVFQSLDVHSRGYVSKHEFTKSELLKSFKISSKTANEIFDLIDLNQDNEISLTEFVAATLHPSKVDHLEMFKAFKLLDDECCGYISKSALRKAALSLHREAPAAKPLTRWLFFGHRPRSNKVTAEYSIEEDLRSLGLDEVDNDAISYDDLVYAISGVYADDTSTVNLVEVKNRTCTETNEDPGKSLRLNADSESCHLLPTVGSVDNVEEAVNCRLDTILDDNVSRTTAATRINNYDHNICLKKEHFSKVSFDEVMSVDTRDTRNLEEDESISPKNRPPIFKGATASRFEGLLETDIY